MIGVMADVALAVMEDVLEVQVVMVVMVEATAVVTGPVVPVMTVVLVVIVVLGSDGGGDHGSGFVSCLTSLSTKVFIFLNMISSYFIV